MSKTAINWADDDGSSDEGSIGGDEVQVTEEPSHEEEVTHTPAPTRGHTVLTVHVSNLAYSVDEKTLETFFTGGGCKVKSVTVHLDRDTKRSRGSAHVEFADRQSLEIALTANNVEVSGRIINVIIAEDRRGFRGGDRGGRGGGRHRDRDFQPRDRDRKDRGEHHSRDRDNRRDRDGPRDGYDNRRGPRGEGYNSGRGGDRPRERERPRGAAPPAAPQAPAAVPAERPKLNLKPRTLPVEAVGAPVVKSSIFGEGKPRDELTVESTKKVEQIESTAVAAVAVDPPPPPTEKEVKTASAQHEDNRGPRKTPDREIRREKGRGGAGRGRSDKDGGRGRGATGRGEKERTPRGSDGPGRGGKQKPKTAHAAAAASTGSDSVNDKARSEPENEQAALLKFQKAQEKIAPREGMSQQAAKKGAVSQVNAFSALCVDDSDDDSSS